MTLAYTKDTAGVEIRLTVSDAQGSYLGQHSEQYQIKNQSGVELQNPAPGWQLEAGSRVVLGFRVSDMSGADTPKANVVWQESRDGSTWGPASLEGGAILHVPSSQGAYYLKAKFDESGAASGSYPKEKVFGFQVVGSVAPVRIEFGAAQGSEYSLGGTFGEQASGKLYGFSSDQTNRVGRFREVEFVQVGRGERVRFNTESYIALGSGESFQCEVGTARVKVTAELGPIEERRGAELKVNGRLITIPSDWWERVVEVTAETTSATGILTITGSADLPLMSVTVEQLPSSAPAVLDAVTQEDVVVLEHLAGWGGERACRWDERRWNEHDSRWADRE